MGRTTPKRRKRPQQSPTKPKCQYLGRVVTRFGAELVIRDEKDQLVRCTSRRKFDHAASGDYVCWQPSDHGNSVVTEILPRKNALTRPDRRGHPKAIAANIDQIIITTAWRPEPSWLLVDQYTMAAHFMDADVVIVVNKSDLSEDSDSGLIIPTLQEYQQLGYTIVHTNAIDGAGVDGVREALSNKTSIFVGQSGVGKSSLIGQILPELSIKVGEISQSGEGSHTTTTADLYTVKEKTYVIDSPGVRDFVLSAVDKEKLSQGYREFQMYARDCRFNNCTHIHEPACQVKQAVESNDIPVGRYQRYVAKYKQLAEAESSADNSFNQLR